MSDSLDKLFRTARIAKPDTSPAEYGFETRLLARLRDERTQAVSWGAFAWRLMPVFAAIVVVLGVWNRSAFTPVSIEAALGGTTSAVFLGE